MSSLDPTNLFPSLYVDNFFDDPDSVREWALQQEYYKPKEGNYPGARTKSVSELNPDLNNEIMYKMFKPFWDPNTAPLKNVAATVNFQKIEPFDNDPKSYKNGGFIHKDADKEMFSVIVYLNPEANPNSGTSLYQIKKGREHDVFDAVDTIHDIKRRCFLENDFHDLSEKWLWHRKMFDEVARYENRYNRAVFVDRSMWHSQTNVHTGHDPRLTLIVFVEKVEFDGNTEWLYPVKRSEKVYM